MHIEILHYSDNCLIIPYIALKVDGLAICRHGRLLECLGQCGVGMASARDILARRTILESERALGNHLTGVGSDDVNTK